MANRRLSTEGLCSGLDDQTAYHTLEVPHAVQHVRYEIRGPLNKRADQLISEGKKITKLNIGNPGAFDFRVPEHVVKAVAEAVPKAEGYCLSKGIVEARKAVVEDFKRQGIDVGIDQVFMGNGVSELIMMAQRALLNPDDEVLIPSPDYPLWTASVVIHEGNPIHYPCRVENGLLPSVAELETLVTPKTKAICIINPNNPTGVVYPESLLKEIAAFAEKHKLLLYADEIYDKITYDGAKHTSIAKFVKKTIVCTFGGLSKVYRACGFRVGWAVFTGDLANASKYLATMELLSSLRLCPNALGQYSVVPALLGPQDIYEIAKPGGRLYEARKSIVNGVAASKYLVLPTPPGGAMYAWVGVDLKKLPSFDDKTFAMDLLEKKAILVCPGTTFNVKYTNYFRLTLLPPPEVIAGVFGKIEELLDEYAKAG